MAFLERIGSEILVNTATVNDQNEQKITKLVGGGFVITWSDTSQITGDPSSYAVAAQVFDATGAKVGSEILVNTTTNSYQGQQQITALDGGGFVVTWRDDSQQNGDSSPAVRAQVFSALGAKVGSEILVNTTTQDFQDSPQITALHDGNGGFVVTWTDFSAQNGDTSFEAARAQIFTATGATVGTEILLNTTTALGQLRPQITAFSESDGGGFVAVWIDNSEQGGDTDGYSVRGQLFTASGGRTGGEFVVNTTTQGNQTDPQTTMLADGFVVTWTDQSMLNGDTDGESVRAQLFDLNGSKVGSEILVNTTTQYGQYAQKITALDGGGFVITWRDSSGLNGDTSSLSVRAQVFAADGAPVGSEILVNTTTDDFQENQQIIALEGGGFVITWHDYSGQTLFIRAQVFADDGTKLGDEFLVNTTTDGGHLNPQITALDDGDFVISWDNNGGGNGDANGYAVRAQVFSVNLPPNLQDQFATVAEDGAVSNNALDGFSDPNGGTISIVAANGDRLNAGSSLQGTYGTLTIGTDGAFTYLANNASALSSGETATDTFTITASDDQGSEVTRNLSFDIVGSDDIIVGTLNADTLNGTGGRDIIFGDDGNDTIDGEAGDDLMLGGAGNDTYTVDAFGDAIVEFENEGTDTVKSTVSWSLADNIEHLTLLGSAFSGTGNTLANTITGTSANNSLNGGTGNDKLIGGNGDDEYFVDAAGDVIVELANQGTDNVVSAAVSYTLAANVENLLLSAGAANGTGNAGNNGIIGNDLANILDGGAGNDEINGGLGADTMKGGAGDDSFVVDDANDTVFELAGGGSDFVFSRIAAYTLAVNVEYLLLDTGAVSGTGNAGNNYITGNAGNNIIDGGAGNDQLYGGGGTDQLTGGAGNDFFYIDDEFDTVIEGLNGGTDHVDSKRNYVLGANVENLTLLDGAFTGIGNGAANVIIGNAAENVLNGLGGIDTLKGGLGNDSYYVDVAGDIVTELANQGTDIVFSTAATYTLSANVENLTLQGSAGIAGTGNALNNIITGNSGNNTLDGAAGNDVLNGGAGADTLKGGAGDDQYFVDVSGDTVTEAANAGIDIVFSTASNFQLSANIENLTITSAAGAASGIGNTGNNIITGNASANMLIGDAGNDTLDGGSAGSDTLVGGKGNDTYYLSHTGTTIAELANEGIDTVIRSFVSSGVLAANVENLILTVQGDAFGNSLNNVITGSIGNNIIVGAGGNDVLKGGGGGDIFYFTGSFGKDIVTDFVGGGGGDKLQFETSEFANEAAILAATTDTATGLVITSGSNTVTLLGFHLNNYTSGDFFIGT